MSNEKTSFVYVTYIRSTPEKVFEAITKPEIARRYWATRTSRIGSPDRLAARARGRAAHGPAGRQGSRGGAADAPGHHVGERFAGSRSGSYSRVSFDVAAYDGYGAADVTHDELEAGSGMAKRHPAGLADRSFQSEVRCWRLGRASTSSPSRRRRASESRFDDRPYTGGCACGANPLRDQARARLPESLPVPRLPAAKRHRARLLPDAFPRARDDDHRRGDALAGRRRQRQREGPRLLPGLRNAGLPELRRDAGPDRGPCGQPRRPGAASNRRPSPTACAGWRGTPSNPSLQVFEQMLSG